MADDDDYQVDKGDFGGAFDDVIDNRDSGGDTNSQPASDSGTDDTGSGGGRSDAVGTGAPGGTVGYDTGGGSSGGSSGSSGSSTNDSGTEAVGTGAPGGTEGYDTGETTDSQSASAPKQSGGSNTAESDVGTGAPSGTVGYDTGGGSSDGSSGSSGSSTNDIGTNDSGSGGGRSDAVGTGAPGGTEGYNNESPTDTEASGSTNQQQVSTTPPPGAELSGEEAENLIEANKAYQEGRISRDRVGDLRQQYLSNDAKTEEAQAQQLQQQAVAQSDVLDSPADVNVVRDGDRLSTRLSDQGRQSLREDVASQDPRISPADVELSREDGQLVAEASVQPQGDREPSGEAGPALERLSGTGGDELAGTQPQTSGRQATQSPELLDPASEADRQTVSPLASMAVTNETREQAVAGSREVARRAESGDAGAQLAEFGRDVQERYTDVGDAVTETVPSNEGGFRVGAADESVDQQFADFVGGAAAFPGVIAGGAAQAGGLVATSDTETAVESAGTLTGTATEATASQAEYFAERPVEGVLFGLTAAAGSGAGRSSIRAAASRGRAAARSAGNSGSVRDFVSADRGQAELVGGQRGRSRGSGDEGIPQSDPVRRQATEGRRAGGRAVEDSSTTVRGQPRTLERSQQFAERARAIERLRQPDAEPAVQVRNLDPAAPRSTQSQNVATNVVADLEQPVDDGLQRQQQAQEFSVTPESESPTTPDTQSQTAARSTESVVTGGLDRLGQAEQDPITFRQRGQVDGSSETQPTFVSEDTAQGARQRQEQAQESATPDIQKRDQPAERLREDAQQRPGERAGQQPSERTTPVDRLVPGQTQSEDSSTMLDTPNPPSVGTPGLPGLTSRPPGTPRRPPRGPPRNPPTPPLPSLGDIGGGGGAGRSGPSPPSDSEGLLAPGWASETVTTIATGGSEPVDAPSQSALEDQPTGLRLTGELPTRAFLSGDEETQEDISAVQGLFGVADPVDSGEESDSGGLFDFAGDGDESDGGFLL